MAAAPTCAVATTSTVKLFDKNLNNNLRFRFCNIVSVLNKKTALRVFSAGSDIVGFVETRDCDEYPDGHFGDLRQYNVFRRPRNTHGGGVALLTRRSLKAHRRADLESSDLEMLMVEVVSANLYVCVFYGPPVTVSSTVPALIEHFRNFDQAVISRCVIMGDFNTPKVDWDSKTSVVAHGSSLLQACKEFGWKQLVNFPTRKENILDLIFVPVSFPCLSVVSVPPPVTSCDHLGLELVTNVRRSRPRLLKKQRWIFSSANNRVFQLSLLETDWYSLLRDKDPSLQAEAIEEVIITKAKLQHRLIQYKLRYSSPVLPPVIRRTIKKRDALFARFRKCRPSTHKDLLHGRWKSASRLVDHHVR